jgi:hypothetical protein
MAIVTADQITDHLRLAPGQDANKVALLVEQSTAAVLDYLRMTEDELLLAAGIDGVPAATVPALATAAALIVAGDLYANREGGDPISKAVKDLLARWYVPGFA